MDGKTLKRFFNQNWIDIYRYYIPKTRYAHYYRTLKINEKVALFESQHGTSIHGNILYMLQAMVNDHAYDEFELYFTCRKANEEYYRGFLDSHGLQRVKLTILSTRQYMKLLASAKYLVNNNTFLPFFIKKEGQVYLNTWHGTPLKTLGKKIRNAMYNIGNTQKNFMVADYLLYPNEYTMEHMIEDYMLEDVSKGKALLAGYPRNTAFFDQEGAARIREEYGLTDKKVYAYMPTWRGALGALDVRASTYTQYYLYELDKRLTDDEILYVNLHPIAKKNVQFWGLKHIKQFPWKYETYEFLNMVDCLITDYSSVFYDFAVSRKKCVLFTYDEEEYFADRGLYRPLDSLPFPNVKTADDLIRELRTPKNYDDTEFLREYCPYDGADVAKAVCDKLFFGRDSALIEERAIPNNGKKNILLYSGNLAKNGVTSSLYNLLNNLDTAENNYFITFRGGSVKYYQDTLAALPEGVRYIATIGRMNLGIFKKILWILFKDGKISCNFLMKFFEKEFKMEHLRNYGNVKFDSLIQFTGYEFAKILSFSAFDGNTAIYVHSDMYKEMTVRKNQRGDVLRYAYSKYDHVALVTEDLVECTSRLMKKPRKFDVAHNIISYDAIVARGNAELAFDSYTKSNKDFDEIRKILASSSKKIINIGRFSVEKGQKRLIDSFVRVWEEKQDTYLFIVGGSQRDGLYDELCAYVETLPCADHIVLILAMSNPLPVVKACDGSILTSFYEGFGLALVEADILGLPIVSTDIVGPRTFMQKHNGVLVEDSEAGIEDGLRRLIQGEVPVLTVDYTEYNRNAVNEFKALLKS